MALYLGIDPGLSGALALLCPSNPSTAQVIDMPTRPNPASPTRRHLDLAALHQWLLPLAPLIATSLVEEVSAMSYVDASGRVRGQGAAASFVFGRSFGALEGLLVGMGLGPTLRLTRPAVWKAIMGLTATKESSLEAARRRFPHLGASLSRKKDHGRAEALLLACLAHERFPARHPAP